MGFNLWSLRPPILLSSSKLMQADQALVARAFWVTIPGHGEILDEFLPPPGPGEVRVRTLYTGISRGTESLVFRGEVPPSQHRTLFP